MRIGIYAVAVLTIWLSGAGVATADALKDEAVARLAASHEPDVPLAVARLAVKQAGLRALRKVLATRGREAGLGRDWNAKSPEWQLAEAKMIPMIDALIQRRIEDPSWMRAVMAATAASVLNAEEADEIASHFSTPSGTEQRKVVEIKVIGELLLGTYTFSERIDDRMSGSEAEYSRMQKVWWDREPFKARNFDGDEAAARFGTRNPGVKYVKTLAYRGVEGLLAHINAACAEIVAAMEGAASDVDPFIDAYRQRVGA
ncbi:MAG: hypothetical protein ACKVP2_11040 [Burkholderiales bacterium]